MAIAGIRVSGATPPRLPIVLIAPIPAAAAAPEKCRTGIVQKQAIASEMAGIQTSNAAALIQRSPHEAAAPKATTAINEKRNRALSTALDDRSRGMMRISSIAPSAQGRPKIGRAEWRERGCQNG